MSGILRLLAALVAGALAGAIGWSLAPTGDPTAVATLRLDDQEVRWPYHDAVIQTQAALVDRDDVRDEIAETAGVPVAELLDLNTSVPRNQTIFDVTATATTRTAAVGLVDATAAVLIERNVAERSAGLADRTAAIESELALLEIDLSRQRRSLENADTSEADRLIAEGRLSATAQRLGTLEVELSSLGEAAGVIRPQLVLVRPGEVVDRERTRAVTAVSAGIGVALLVAAAAGFSRPRSPRPVRSLAAA